MVVTFKFLVSYNLCVVFHLAAEIKADPLPLVTYQTELSITYKEISFLQKHLSVCISVIFIIPD